MAFYTAVDEQQLLALLSGFGIDSLSSCIGASDGIENSTYLLRSDTGEWVLTLFEDLSSDEMPFFIDLMQCLHANQLPVACPLADADGQVLHTLSTKPALLFPRLAGSHPSTISTTHCAVMGDFLGRMHRATESYPQQRDNARGTDWMEASHQRLNGLIDAADASLLAEQIANAKYLRKLALPCGLIHGDLFHDNALFIGDRLCGVIDFYNACSDLLLLDLAIMLNDWCAVPSGELDSEKVRAMTEAYAAQRPLTATEQQNWQKTLQLAAARFWLSRLLAEKVPNRTGISHPHKPSSEYRLRLLSHY
jgi:homoserine kinase type II